MNKSNIWDDTRVNTLFITNRGPQGLVVWVVILQWFTFEEHENFQLLLTVLVLWHLCVAWKEWMTESDSAPSTPLSHWLMSSPDTEMSTTNNPT